MDVSDEQASALHAAISSELNHLGVLGTLEITLATARLEGSCTTEVPLAGLRARWNRLDSVQQAREVRRCARRLSRGQRRLGLSAGRLKRAGVLLLGTCALGWHIHSSGRSPRAAAARQAPSQPGAKRAETVCEQAESRVMRGGTLGPAESEGWILEAAFARPKDSPPAEDWSGLLGAEGAAYTVVEGALPDSLKGGAPEAVAVTRNRGTEGYEEFVFSFDQRVVRSYLRSGERQYWTRLAGELYGRLGATHGALFARCAHRAPRHAGTWFAGADETRALAALIYFVGPHADVPHVGPDVLGLYRSGTLLPRLDEAIGAVSREDLGRRLSIDHGMVQASEGGPITILFPLKDSNRASRASRRVAQELGLSTSPSEGVGAPSTP